MNEEREMTSDTASTRVNDTAIIFGDTIIRTYEINNLNYEKNGGTSKNKVKNYVVFECGKCKQENTRECDSYYRSDPVKNGNNGCSKCYPKKSGQSRATPWETIVQYFVDEGYEMISTQNDYINAKSKLNIECVICGVKLSTSYNNFKSRKSRACKECSS
jgi:CapR-like protein